jgi:hypothetical protein
MWPAMTISWPWWGKSRGAAAAAVYDGTGQATFDVSLAAVRLRGYLVVYGTASGPVPAFNPQRLAAGGSLFITCPTLSPYIPTTDELLRRATTCSPRSLAAGSRGWTKKRSIADRHSRRRTR